jgi:hypothetical protein
MMWDRTELVNGEFRKAGLVVDERRPLKVSQPTSRQCTQALIDSAIPRSCTARS